MEVKEACLDKLDDACDVMCMARVCREDRAIAKRVLDKKVAPLAKAVVAVCRATTADYEEFKKRVARMRRSHGPKAAYPAASGAIRSATFGTCRRAFVKRRRLRVKFAPFFGQEWACDFVVYDDTVAEFWTLKEGEAVIAFHLYRGSWSVSWISGFVNFLSLSALLSAFCGMHPRMACASSIQLRFYTLLPGGTWGPATRDPLIVQQFRRLGLVATHPRDDHPVLHIV